MAMLYKAYLSGLDMLAAIAIMLPFAFLLAYAMLNGNSAVHAHAEEALETIVSNTKMQEVLGMDWQNASALSSMLVDSLGSGYTVAKAPLYPAGAIPPNALRLAVVGGDVYYIEGETNESTNVN
ncbi:MAG: hypothetical protein ACP5MZ_03950 [Candidatus Micrarchaeia archaeon]